MTYKEVVDAIDRELELIVPKIEEAKRRFESLVKKARRYPVERHLQIESRYKTTFHVIFRALKRSSWDNPVLLIYVPFFRSDGMYVAYVSKSRHKTVIFTSHFFTRYRERILGGDTTTPTPEMVKQFLASNFDMLLTEATENFVKKVDRYEQECKGTPFACVMPQGCGFGELDGDAVIVRTIISNDMLRDGQDEAFATLRSRLEFYRDLKKRLSR